MKNPSVLLFETRSLAARQAEELHLRAAWDSATKQAPELLGFRELHDSLSRELGVDEDQLLRLPPPEVLLIELT